MTIERKIFEAFVKSNFRSLELMISPDCDCCCSYCYMKRFNVGSIVMSKDTIDTAISLYKNLRTDIFELLLFGGEPTLHIDLVEYILNKYSTDDQIVNISFPTNGAIVSNNYNFFHKLLATFPKLRLSFSIDGPFCDPLQRISLTNTSINYDKLFDLNKDFIRQTGFHPMIYAKTVDKLFDTLKWFVVNINSNDTVEDRVNFLPVRNPNDWNTDNLKILKEQMRKCREYFKQEKISLKNTNFNLFKRYHIVRGLTCSLQNNLHVDWYGNVWPCHRLMYPEFLIGNIKNYEQWNFERLLPFLVYHRNNNILCGSCTIWNPEECLGSCLGANYERWGDPFIHVNSVCQLLRVVHKEVVDA